MAERVLMSRSAGAREIVELVADSGSWTSWDSPIERAHPADYEDELERVRNTTGYDEAVITGSASIRGHRVAVIVGEFGFLGGSIGVDAGARIADAVRRATAERLPVLAMPTSGGTRMQEGTTAFVQMIRITAAVDAHKAVGLAYLVYLRHPTTGGVLASWGSLGHITMAEPEAMIGFLGPRVYEAMTGIEFPKGVQTAEHLLEHGVIDAVVPTERLAAEVGSILDIVHTSATDRRVADAPLAGSPTSWECVSASRDPHRPGARELLRSQRIRVTRLAGSAEGDVDPSVVLALARIDGHSCVLVAQDRAAGKATGVEGLRVARRGIRLAVELGLPLVTVIDTSGAELSGAAEENGIAGQIARCLSAMVAATVPTVAALLGQGTGGAALALLPADRVVAAEYGWLSPLPPEGASAIVYRDIEHAAEMANRQGVGSADLAATGVVDVVVGESGPLEMLPDNIIDAISGQLSELSGLSEKDRMYARHRRFEKLGTARPASV